VFNHFPIDTRRGSNGEDLSPSESRPLYFPNGQPRRERWSLGPVCGKRKRAHYSNNDNPAFVPTQNTELLLIGNTESVEQYYMVRFKDMQQSACKVMGKAFVKLVEPKKQTHHPYTKGDSKAPPWWPETSGEHGVRHKEPDHLYKPGKYFLFPTSFLY
jgi:hypothetical protein